MRFTERTDIAVKILIHLSLLKGEKISIDDLVERYIGHRSQVVAAVQELRKAGMIASIPGRRGGIWINKPPETIFLAEVVRMFETDFCLVKCFSDPSSCSIFHCCKFKEVLKVALDQFFGPLETTSIADLVKDLDDDVLKETAQAC
ncbi:Rrf2 family transcriptional regulator [uncultured Roseibium sp.]|uniref:RrF2 family transcriptional regulator n=1 Tax=uncultured Roseibium sp. TaxID=1936171 RepID=UPI003217DE01